MFFLLFLAILICPFLFFFIKIRSYKKSLEPVSEELRSIHTEKAKKYFSISLGTCLLVLLIPPFVALLVFSKLTRGTTEIIILGAIVLSFSAFIYTLVATANGIKHSRLADKSSKHIWLQTIVAIVAQLGFLTYFLGGAFLILAGMGWGRPLRVGGKILKPTLHSGDEWAQGEKPDIAGLNEPTRRALEALWLHDAKKEYASVPAFSRLGWQLAALAAPPELLRDVHIAALQEIEHARKCFALAAGFGDQPQTVLPMPDMLKESYRSIKNLLPEMATESLTDGCLLEGFNADVAHRSAEICQDPASLRLIKQIAREERSHAELSWRIVEFCYAKDSKVAKVLREEMTKLATLSRPTASSSQNLFIVQAADQEALVRYGRLPDSEFDVIWNNRINETRERLLCLFNDNDEVPKNFTTKKKYSIEATANKQLSRS